MDKKFIEKSIVKIEGLLESGEKLTAPDTLLKVLDASDADTETVYSNSAAAIVKALAEHYEKEDRCSPKVPRISRHALRVGQLVRVWDDEAQAFLCGPFVVVSIIGRLVEVRGLVNEGCEIVSLSVGYDRIFAEPITDELLLRLGFKEVVAVKDFGELPGNYFYTELRSKLGFVHDAMFVLDVEDYGKVICGRDRFVSPLYGMTYSVTILSNLSMNGETQDVRRSHTFSYIHELCNAIWDDLNADDFEFEIEPLKEF